MKVTVLGSGTLVPSAGRGSPGLVVEAAGEKLLFDSGSGTFYRAAGAGIDWRSFSCVFYTHLHPDHTLDLVSLLFAGNYVPGQETGLELAVYGPQGLGDFIDSLCVAWPAITPKNYCLRLKELSHDATISGEAGWEVTAAKVSHGQAQSLAYRVTYKGKSVVFTGDTEYCESLVELSRGGDLLVCECSTDDSRIIPGHLSPKGVARLASESGVPHVVITHVYPPADPEELARCCAGQCDSSVTAARDLDVYDV